jgi:hypothetical protein
MDYGFVYLIVEWGSEPERYKIGISKNDPKLRLKTHQTSNPHELVLLRTYKSEYYQRIESTMKRDYSKYILEGGTEWFQLPPEIASKFRQECIRIEDVFINLKESGNPFI